MRLKPFSIAYMPLTGLINHFDRIFQTFAVFTIPIFTKNSILILSKAIFYFENILQTYIRVCHGRQKPYWPICYIYYLYENILLPPKVFLVESRSNNFRTKINGYSGRKNLHFAKISCKTENCIWWLEASGQKK